MVEYINTYLTRPVTAILARTKSRGYVNETETDPAVHPATNRLIRTCVLDLDQKE